MSCGVSQVSRSTSVCHASSWPRDVKNQGYQEKIAGNELSLGPTAHERGGLANAELLQGGSLVNFRPQPPLPDAQKQYRFVAARIAGAIAA